MRDDSRSGATPRIVSAVIDQARSLIELHRSDGKVATFPHLTSPNPGSQIARLSHYLEVNVLHVETTRGDSIIAELPSLGHLAPLNGRPVVYLDKKDWSTLALTHDPERVKDAAEREAADELIRLAVNKKIILPLSAGHMAETCRWPHTDDRYRLALRMAQLSAGWQMRDPLAVRGFEIRDALHRRFRSSWLLPRATFTLEPNAVFDDAQRGGRPVDVTDFPPETALVLQAMTAYSGNLDVMLDLEATAMNDVPGWVDWNQQFTRWLKTSGRDAQQRRQSTEGFFIADVRRELAKEAILSGFTTDELAEWLREHRRPDVADMPCLGLFREVLHEKTVNPESEWKINDLTDMIYLTCAAGYADYDVGERSLVAQMRQALKRLGRPAKVYRRIKDLVPVLERDLEKLAQDRVPPADACPGTDQDRHRRP